MGTLDPNDNFNSRWLNAQAMWDFNTVSSNLQSKMGDLYYWEVNGSNDSVTDTLHDIYYTKFISSGLGESLNISVTDWLEQPRFKCDRDVTVALNCRRRLKEAPADKSDGKSELEDLAKLMKDAE